MLEAIMEKFGYIKEATAMQECRMAFKRELHEELRAEAEKVRLADALWLLHRERGNLINLVKWARKCKQKHSHIEAMLVKVTADIMDTENKLKLLEA